MKYSISQVIINKELSHHGQANHIQYNIIICHLLLFMHLSKCLKSLIGYPSTLTSFKCGRALSQGYKKSKPSNPKVHKGED
jgi:hypothetical protein